MNAALGSTGIAIGFTGALFGIITLVAGLRGSKERLLRSGRSYVAVVVAGSLAAVVAMQIAILRNDTSVAFVADNSSKLTPFPYDVATMWSALEGSILLWSLVLSAYIGAITYKFRARLTDPLVAWALVVLFAISMFFFALMLPGVGPADPFQTVDVPAGFDGPGPNPLLQNHILMAVHPPMLYLGYVGFSVPFAFALAAMITGRLGEGWLVETRRWTLFAWGFLSLGIVLGAWWSYEVLGWGGAWAWDPVENASLLPWLTGTAYIHSVMVQERRGMLRVWNLVLLCATFSLTILGTFLTRSGVLNSVHAFSESHIGPWLLSFFALSVLVTVGLLGWRGDRLRSPGRIDSPLSREGAFLINNLVFAVFAFVILLGTVWPLIVEAVNGQQLTVGRPWFDFFSMILGLVLLGLMAVAPALPWRKTQVETLARRLQWPAWTGAACLVVAVASGARGWAPLTCYLLGGFASGAAVRQVVLATRRQGIRGFVGRTNGGMIVHLGIIVLVVGYVSSYAFQTAKDVTMQVGDVTTIEGHTVEYLGRTSGERSNHTYVGGRFRVDGDRVFEPQIRRYPRSSMEVPTPSVRTGVTEDIYLTLLAVPSGSDEIKVKIISEPLAVWMWIGGIVVVVGSALSAFPGRRRNPLDPVSAPLGAGAKARDEVAAAVPVGGPPAEGAPTEGTTAHDEPGAQP